jgi:DNA repair exonuclease SbcCD ATPase subunit
MYSSLEAAVDMAIISVIQQRTGFFPGFLMLDECFNGQSSETKEAVVQVLRTIAENKLVIVVDHHTEMQEAFDQILEIVVDNGESKVIG